MLCTQDGRLSEHIQDASETSESKESSAHEQEAAIENNSLSFPTLVRSYFALYILSRSLVLIYSNCNHQLPTTF